MYGFVFNYVMKIPASNTFGMLMLKDYDEEEMMKIRIWKRMRLKLKVKN